VENPLVIYIIVGAEAPRNTAEDDGAAVFGERGECGDGAFAVAGAVESVDTDYENDFDVLVFDIVNGGGGSAGVDIVFFEELLEEDLVIVA